MSTNQFDHQLQAIERELSLPNSFASSLVTTQANLLPESRQGFLNKVQRRYEVLEDRYQYPIKVTLKIIESTKPLFRSIGPMLLTIIPSSLYNPLFRWLYGSSNCQIQGAQPTSRAR